MAKEEPKHKVPFDEFVKAVKGEPYNKTEWFYTADGYDIEISAIDSALFTAGQNYIVLQNCEIVKSADQRDLLLSNIDLVSKPAFVFFRCVLPEIILQNCQIAAWFFHESTAENIIIEKNSAGGNISVEGSDVRHISVGDNSKCGYVWVGLGSKVESVNFSNGSTGDFIEVLIDSTCDNININKKCKVDSVRVNNEGEVGNIKVDNYSSIGSIIISDARAKNINIEGGSECEDIEVIDDGTTWDITVDGGKVKSISISRMSQCEKVIILSNSQVERVFVEDGSKGGDYWIKDSRVGQITIINNFFSAYLYNSVVPFIRFVQCFIQELAWNAGMRGELYMDGGKLNCLRLYKTAILKDSVFSLNNVQVFIVQLQELLVHGQLVFRNISPNQEPFIFNLDSLATSNNHSVSIDYYSAIANKFGLAPGELNRYKTDMSVFSDSFKGRNVPLFCIVDSSLGKTEITGCDLEHFHFEYRDSKLLESFFSGTKLPRENIKIYKEDPENKLPLMNYYTQKVSIYNQLKKIFDNQGDLVESTWYHAKAMDYQEKLLKEDFKQRGKLFNEQWFDVTRFWLNKVTNNHGESWRLALRFIFLVSFGLYSFYYFSIHYKEHPSFAALGRFLSNYILFLDPTHKIDFHVSKSEMGILPIFFDFAGRILIAFGIYQLIAAFRKHSRKSA